VKGLLRFVLLATLAIVVVGALFAVVFSSPADRRAIQYSAVIALVVQVATFLVVRRAAPAKLMSVWGLGAVVRLAVLLIYGLALLRPWGLPPTAALLSLASFFFVTTLIESRSLTV
jgi:ABC-type branched-subunit amino acid transport system permease subunit